MEHKTARLTLLIDPNKKAAFERLCAQQDVTPSQVVRRLIREYLAQHGVPYQPSGKSEVDAAAAEAAPHRPRRRRGPKAARAPRGRKA
jgi:antitoxin component of RelBE/YafQ-DinJ toxin-antitoxin module